MKKCKHCQKRLFFWNKQIRGYHHKCVYSAYMGLVEYYNIITYVPFSNGEQKPKRLTVREYKELKKDLEELRLFIQKKLLKYAESDKNQ